MCSYEDTRRVSMVHVVGGVVGVVCGEFEAVWCW